MNIILDSGCDKNAEMRGPNDVFDFVPLALLVDGTHFVDDEGLVLVDYLSAMEACKGAVKTAAPSPHQFLERFKRDGASFVVTFSSKLSASYSNALLAKNLYLEEARDKFIHVFDSLSATCGETLIAMKIKELLAEGAKNGEVVQKVNGFIKELKTYFVLERYENLVKGGRMKPWMAMVAGALAIRPICQGVDGQIAVVGKQRGTKRALERLAEIIAETAAREKINTAARTLAISHALCLDKAHALRDAILAKTPFKETLVMEMSGVCATYAERGGVTVAF